MPIEGIIRKDAGINLIKDAQRRAVCGEVLRECFCAKLVADPADGEIVPVKA